jgi:hypoxanthine phosphoribosyltransferase
VNWRATAPELGTVLIGHEQVQARVRELGRQITDDYAGRSPLLVCVLKGAFMFMGDLARAIDRPLEVDFMAVSSYGNSTRTSGVVRIVKDLDIDLAGRDVLVVEDVVDSGLTLSYLRRNLLARNPASLEVCALLARANRQGSAKVADEVRYIGFTIGDEFVVGYGLDAAERFRNVGDICAYVPPADHRGSAKARQEEQR